MSGCSFYLETKLLLSKMLDIKSCCIDETGVFGFTSRAPQMKFCEVIDFMDGMSLLTNLP